MKYGGNTSCIQIELDGSDELIVADCGTGFRNLGNELTSNGHHLEGRIFITHPHWDHLQGFPFFKPFYNSKNTFKVFMPPQDEAGCKEILQGHLSNTFFPVSIDMLESELECTTFKKGRLNFENYSVEYMWANHTVPTAIYKFKFGSRVVVFAPDNELPIQNEGQPGFIEEFRAFVKGVDVLIHDAQFTKEQHKDRLGWGHSDWETLIDVTKDLGISHLVLTHHDPDHCDEVLDKMDEEVANYAPNSYESVGLIKEGQELSLS